MSLRFSSQSQLKLELKLNHIHLCYCQINLIYKHGFFSSFEVSISTIAKSSTLFSALKSQDPTNHIVFNPILKVEFSFLILAVAMPLLLFLLTPIRVPLNVPSPFPWVVENSLLWWLSQMLPHLILAPSLFLVPFFRSRRWGKTI